MGKYRLIDVFLDVFPVITMLAVVLLNNRVIRLETRVDKLDRGEDHRGV